jgi:hypothetical protein
VRIGRCARRFHCCSLVVPVGGWTGQAGVGGPVAAVNSCCQAVAQGHAFGNRRRLVGPSE